MTTINNLTIEQMREIISKAPSNAESYQGGYYFRESPQFMFHNGFHDQWNLTDNDGLYFRAAGFHPVRIDDLRTAIAEHDSREFKVGDLVCFIDSRIMFPDGETKTNELFKVIRSDGLEVDLTELGKLKVYKTWVGDLRHATPSEIKAGHRIDDTTDHVTDIRNHVSPSTTVVDL